MQTIRLTLLATLVTTAFATPAFAIRAADELVLPEPPVEVVRGDSVVSAHVLRNGDELEACLAKGRADTVNARVRITWDWRGNARAISVRGGTAAFRRCAREALEGKLPILRRRRGSGSAAFIVRRPVSPDPLA